MEMLSIRLQPTTQAASTIWIRRWAGQRIVQPIKKHGYKGCGFSSRFEDAWNWKKSLLYWFFTSIFWSRHDGKPDFNICATHQTRNLMLFNSPGYKIFWEMHGFWGFDSKSKTIPNNRGFSASPTYGLIRWYPGVEVRTKYIEVYL